jgi:hypothetical protein
MRHQRVPKILYSSYRFNGCFFCTPGKIIWPHCIREEEASKTDTVINPVLLAFDQPTSGFQ